MKTHTESLQNLAAVLAQESGLAFAALVGSRATGKYRPDSDWDIALMWRDGVDEWALLGKAETLRRTLAAAIDAEETAIDLIDLRRANLAMHARVAEVGQPLWLGNSLDWNKFLQRTWREIEDYKWSTLMELELYQAETARIAATQAANLEDARQILASGRTLSRLEFSGLQRALQVSIENVIGKANVGLKNAAWLAPSLPTTLSAH